MGHDELIAAIEEIEYSFEKLSRDYQPGQHASAVAGSGFHIKGYRTLFEHPEFDHIDWNATALAGSRMPLVKILEQKSAITVMCVVDMTGSSGFSGVVEKSHEMAKCVVSLGFSAYKIGDRFGCIVYRDRVEEVFEPRMSRTYSLEIGEWLWDLEPRGSISDDAFLEVLGQVPERPLLFIWISDFYYSSASIKKMLHECEEYDVVPMVFIDSAEYHNLPSWGIGWLKDPETGEVRQEVFTPQRHKEFESAGARHCKELIRIFKEYDRVPYVTTNKVSASMITEFFIQRRKN